MLDLHILPNVFDDISQTSDPYKIYIAKLFEVKKEKVHYWLNLNCSATVVARKGERKVQKLSSL